MLNIALNFQTKGAPAELEPMGNGHINSTYVLTDDRGNKYTFQKINDRIFKDVPALMQNIRLVTRALSEADPDPRHSLRLVSTRAGESFFKDDSGYYRMYEYVGDSVCYERAENVRMFRQSAEAFGAFQRQLAHFDASLLSETIPRFHDTRNRVANLIEAAKNDCMGRLNEVKREFDFAIERQSEAGLMLDMLKAGEIKLRVTHNDTKLNNVLFDEKTNAPVCVIDLDTVMPGLAANDFGDSIRFGASTASEDEQNLDAVEMSLELFKAYAEGFLSACGSSLEPAEISTLPMGAKLMTYECGVRFLTDYLMGDTYFRIHRERHNLDRCRTQFKLVYDMERKWGSMNKAIEEAWKK